MSAALQTMMARTTAQHLCWRPQTARATIVIMTMTMRMGVEAEAITGTVTHMDLQLLQRSACGACRRRRRQRKRSCRSPLATQCGFPAPSSCQSVSLPGLLVATAGIATAHLQQVPLRLLAVMQAMALLEAVAAVVLVVLVGRETAPSQM